ncbi:MAG TPA: DNA mismatch repair protein [Pedobacter sp.]
MSFITDKQTLDDLNVLGKYKPNSIFNLFNRVQTAGGEKLLEHLFQHPLTDAAEINKRSRIFRYFHTQQLVFPFLPEQFNTMENYLYAAGAGNLLYAGISGLKKQLLGATIKDSQYEQLLSGIKAAINILNVFYGFIDKLTGLDADHPYLEQVRVVQAILTDKRLDGLIKERGTSSLSFARVVRYDHLFRNLLQTEMKTLMEIIHHLDVYIAVGHVARSRSFSHAEALPKEKNIFLAEELRHPGLEKGIANPVSLHQDSNLIFLTGANMAGKSTFMKTFGISVYLAHMGFPVAAKSLVFSVRDGIYTSINVPDNLNLGYSHFYAEVLRVKKVAEEVSRSKDLVVIFDELFKGTNVKDAYDATLAVTAAFAAYRNCLFIISTHIIEVGEALQKEHGHMKFLYLPTVMDGNIPRYTYQLQEGITTDRQGMMIIRNEGILEILREKRRT